jgi:hypothetical protein
VFTLRCRREGSVIKLLTQVVELHQRCEVHGGRQCEAQFCEEQTAHWSGGT